VLPWWTVLLGVAAVAATIWVSTWWLLHEADGGPADRRAERRIDAIRTGLSVGAATGGAFALLLAVRRQWLHERAQAHQEDVATATEFDAAERRITDLYAKAVDQLGSDKASVRLGGLYALERLAQDNSTHRQTIVNVVCAYLRMPYQPDGGLDSREERQVRLAAQRILAEHLRPSDPRSVTAPEGQLRSARFWEDIRLDLTGATLINFDLSEARVAEATFYQATFIEAANFNRTTFTSAANFACAAFHLGGYFQRTTFADGVYFGDTSFTLTAYFRGATFIGDVRFGNATFTRPPGFDEASAAGFIHELLVNLHGARTEDLTKWSTWPPGWTVNDAGELKPV
jgi:uncharacterized protein YjbI with pentapeptide repeats